MPFKSKAQQRWMFANHPEMAKKWADETPNIKNLPEKKKKKEIGGILRPKGCMSCGGKMQPGGPFLGEGDTPNPYNWMNVNPAMPVRPQQPNEAAYAIAPQPVTQIAESREPKGGLKVDPYFALRGAKTGLAWLGNQIENKRQDQYMYNQFSTMGQIDPMPASNFQPNPFSLYAKYGGKLKAQFGGDPVKGLIPQPQYRMSQTARPANAKDSAEYLSNFQRAPHLSTMAPGVLGGHTSNNMLEYQMKAILAPSMRDAIMDGSKVNYDYAANEYSALQDWQEKAGVMSDEQVRLELQRKLMNPKDILRPKKKEGGSINPAHKGWCTPMTKSTCTGKRRQFALNMKKMARKND